MKKLLFYNDIKLYKRFKKKNVFCNSKISEYFLLLYKTQVIIIY